MQLSEGVEWAVHACVLLSLVPPGQSLPAAKLAEYHELPPAYMAKHLQALSNAGIVTSVAGRRGGYRLARPAADVTMLEVVEAVEGRGPAFRCTEIRQRGPAAVEPHRYTAPCGVARAMWDAEAAWRDVLAGVTVLDLLGTAASHSTPVAIRRSAQWLQEAVR